MIRMKSKVPFITVIALLAATLACSLSNSPETIYITATPIGGEFVPTNAPIVITATPQVTDTPAPIPTATLVPSEGMRQGNLAIRNGNYEVAVNTLRNVLSNESLEDSIRAEAAFRMGQASMREGLFAEAVQSLTSFINQFPQDSRVGQAYFIRGEAYM